MRCDNHSDDEKSQHEERSTSSIGDLQDNLKQPKGGGK